MDSEESDRYRKPLSRLQAHAWLFSCQLSVVMAIGDQQDLLKGLPVLKIWRTYSTKFLMPINLAVERTSWSWESTSTTGVDCRSDWPFAQFFQLTSIVMIAGLFGWWRFICNRRDVQNRARAQQWEQWEMRLWIVSGAKRLFFVLCSFHSIDKFERLYFCWRPECYCTLPPEMKSIVILIPTSLTDSWGYRKSRKPRARILSLLLLIVMIKSKADRRGWAQLHSQGRALVRQVSVQECFQICGGALNSATCVPEIVRRQKLVH